MRRLIPCFLLLTLLNSSCTTNSSAKPTPTYDPFATALPQNSNIKKGTALPSAPITGATPTRSILSVIVPAPGDSPIMSPTPDLPHPLPPPREFADRYTVKSGDTLASIALEYGITVEMLAQANSMSETSVLSVDKVLNIPAPIANSSIGPSFKIIPDSELVYGPASAQFALDEFINAKGGYLADYTQELNGETLTAAQIITRVAQNYSVNPRLLLALIEYRSGWVNNSNPENTTYPLGLYNAGYAGLYLQLTWAANTLNRGYYLWRANAVATWVIDDGSVVPINPTINAGTAGVQYFFAKVNNRSAWENDVSAFGLFQTYFFLFGNPFDLGVDPLLPGDLAQPPMELPFASNETWSFTGGPHGGWDSGSAWAALDFAPPGEGGGCDPSSSWVTATANGAIVRAGNGEVIQDLDNDGYEQTGWIMLYMHIASVDRVEPGTYLYTGDKIGHPSCEGGIANATHLHLARRYNGEWIAADGNNPFVLSGWVSSGNGTEYDGWLTREATVIEAWDGRNEINQISR